MRHEGKLTDWNDGKGFGFITPTAGGPRVFVHISAFPGGGRRPRVNETMTYHVTRDSKNRLRAQKVLFLKAASHAPPRSKGLVMAGSLAAAFFALLATLNAVGHVPLKLVGAYALVSVITFVMYGFDKTAAEKGHWRISEATLHFVELIGGWPGALVAQRGFRHKTRKQPFQAIFWCAATANCAALAWLLYTGETASLLASLGLD